jgi:hypothetical protein
MNVNKFPDDGLDGFETYEDSAWFAAVRAADTWRDASLRGPKKNGDLGELVVMLCSKLTKTAATEQVNLKREECELLIGLLSRHRFKQKPGGRKVPLYKRSRAELKLEIAAKMLRYYQDRGLSDERAVELVSRKGYVKASTLEALRPERRPRRKVNEDELNGFEYYEDSPWFAAIRKADTWRDASSTEPQNGDPNELVNLLRQKSSNAVPSGRVVVLTQQECELLVDLFSRHRLKQKPGGRKLSIYKGFSWADLKLEVEAEMVRSYQSQGLTFEQAIDLVVTKSSSGVRASTLTLYMKGRYHAERRRRGENARSDLS